jgi:hypothetical protein
MHKRPTSLFSSVLCSHLLSLLSLFKKPLQQLINHSHTSIHYKSPIPIAPTLFLMKSSRPHHIKEPSRHAQSNQTRGCPLQLNSQSTTISWLHQFLHFHHTQFTTKTNHTLLNTATISSIQSPSQTHKIPNSTPITTLLHHKPSRVQNCKERKRKSAKGPEEKWLDEKKGLSRCHRCN